VTTDFLDWQCWQGMCYMFQQPEYHAKDCLVLLDTPSTKHDHHWIGTLWTCSCVCGIGATNIKVSIFDRYQ